MSSPQRLTPDAAFTVARRSYRRRRTARAAGATVAAVAVVAGVGAIANVRDSTKPTLVTVSGGPDTSNPLGVSTGRTAFGEIEAVLKDSSVGRRNLNDGILSPFTACSVSGSAAASQMDAVISNRIRILGSAAQLAGSSDPTVAKLGGLLQQAMQYSLDSNYRYQAWMRDEAGLSCPRRSTTEKAGGDAASELATRAKTEFVNAYNPIARSIGMRADWTASDI